MEGLAGLAEDLALEILSSHRLNDQAGRVGLDDATWKAAERKMTGLKNRRDSLNLMSTQKLSAVRAFQTGRGALECPSKPDSNMDQNNALCLADRLL